MAEATTIARPYAKAAFAHASETNSLARWSAGLAAAAAVVADPRVAPLLGSPHVTTAQLADFILSILDEIGDSKPDDASRNFLRTLAENRRLGVLPEVAGLFNAMKDAAERTIDVELTSATALDERQNARIAASLEQRLGRRVRLLCTVNPALLGGAIVQAGDLVIDGSLRSQVDRLRYELTA